eukprot:Phypoly_transcript_13652.p1 GENE.Phypoly_transcript_13652~~Phypoly_transcript_13652.p1  ORF type:complete len:142 (+),score=18.80 Phypoly_transcript_13652:526-951(+)
MFPDTASLYLPYHTLVFWVQHWLVYLLPFYFVFVRRFALDQDWCTYLVAVAIAHLVFWNVQLPVSLFTSINVNYTLYPAPGTPPFLGGKFYRQTQGFIHASMLGINGVIMGKLAQALSNMVFPQKSSPKIAGRKNGTKKRK